MVKLGNPSQIQESLPDCLARHISKEEWAAMKGSFKKIQSDAHCQACGIEWGVCICFGCFCVFFGHVCIVNMIMRGELDQ